LFVEHPFINAIKVKSVQNWQGRCLENQLNKSCLAEKNYNNSEKTIERIQAKLREANFVDLTELRAIKEYELSVEKRQEWLERMYAGFETLEMFKENKEFYDDVNVKIDIKVLILVSFFLLTITAINNFKNIISIKELMFQAMENVNLNVFVVDKLYPCDPKMLNFNIIDDVELKSIDLFIDENNSDSHGLSKRFSVDDNDIKNVRALFQKYQDITKKPEEFLAAHVNKLRRQFKADLRKFYIARLNVIDERLDCLEQSCSTFLGSTEPLNFSQYILSYSI
jgi:hypothetical protein